MIDRNIENGIIESTFLGIEDHGIFVHYLIFEFDGSGQGSGSYSLDNWDEKKNKRVGIGEGIDLIKETLEVVGVEKWEDLRGVHVRVDHDYDKVYGFGHILKDKWLYFDKFFDEHKLDTK